MSLMDAEIRGTGLSTSRRARSVFKGFADQNVRLPGDRRYRTREQSAREGIAVSVALLERIRSLIP